MSGRRRRDDGWDDGRLDAQDDLRDPWAEDNFDEWGNRGDLPDEADRQRKPAGGAAGGYARGGQASGKGYAAPDFPSFQATTASPAGDRYGSGPGNGGSRGSADGYSSGSYGADGYLDREPGPGGYQGAGYGRGGGNGAASGYGRGANGSSPGHGNDSGYGNGLGGANGAPGGANFIPEFTPADGEEPEDNGLGSIPRPYGRLSIYTLHDDKTREFDRLAERAAEGVRTAEPDTLVYVIHVVPKAPQQRIIYEIYRDRAAFMSHERQPHIRQFTADRASCVLATNIIDLRLKYAKVAALGSAGEAAQQQPARGQRGAEATQASDRYAATAQYSPSPQYASAQYQPSQQQGPGAAAASFTPAAERFGADNGQYPTVGREAYSPAPQYGNAGSGGYGTGNGQYGAANSNGYSGAAGYANGGSYSSNGYPGANGYQSANGYPGDNGYSGASGYQSANGYSGTNGYSGGNGYQAGSGYPNGTNGYGGAGGYSNGSGYGSDAAANGAGNSYGSPGYPQPGGSYGASASTQYTPRYRELTSGSGGEAAGQAGNGNRHQDEGRQSARPSEWDQRPPGYR